MVKVKSRIILDGFDIGITLIKNSNSIGYHKRLLINMTAFLKKCLYHEAQ